jgi:hypothetical protein
LTATFRRNLLPVSSGCGNKVDIGKEGSDVAKGTGIYYLEYEAAGSS